MTSQIDTSQIVANFPAAGVDNDSQTFRDNFSNIKTALDTAADEITDIQTVVNTLDAGSKLVGTSQINTLTNTATSTGTNTGALVVTGGVGIGKDLYVGGSCTVEGFTNIIDVLAVGVRQNSSDFYNLSGNLFGIWSQPLYSTSTSTFGVAAVAQYTTGSVNLAGAVYVHPNDLNAYAKGSRGLALYTATEVSSNLVFTSYFNVGSSGTLTIIDGHPVRFNPGLVFNIGTGPLNTTAPGIQGQMVVTDSHIYICTATNQWKRVALSAW